MAPLPAYCRSWPLQRFRDWNYLFLISPFVNRLLRTIWTTIWTFHEVWVICIFALRSPPFSSHYGDEWGENLWSSPKKILKKLRPFHSVVESLQRLIFSKPGEMLRLLSVVKYVTILQNGNLGLFQILGIEDEDYKVGIFTNKILNYLHYVGLYRPLM